MTTPFKKPAPYLGCKFFAPRNFKGSILNSCQCVFCVRQILDLGIYYKNMTFFLICTSTKIQGSILKGHVLSEFNLEKNNQVYLKGRS